MKLDCRSFIIGSKGRTEPLLLNPLIKIVCQRRAEANFYNEEGIRLHSLFAFAKRE